MDFDNLPPVIREQIPLNQALASALIAAIPSGWRIGRLRIAWTDYETPGSIQAVGETLDDPCETTDQLRQAAAEFTAFRTKYRLPFQAVLLEVRAVEETGWQMSLGFE